MDDTEEYVCDPHITILSEETIVEETKIEEEEFNLSILEVNSNYEPYEEYYLENPGSPPMFKMFSYRRAKYILQNISEEKCLQTPPRGVKPGDWYVFSYAHNPGRSRLWHKDGIMWRNFGLRKIPYDGCTLHKRYFKEITNGVLGSLCRRVYELGGAGKKRKRLLVQYLDETIQPKLKSTENMKHKIGKGEWQGLFTALSDKQAAELLGSPGDAAAITVRTQKPTHGYWYIYKYGKETSRSGLWRADGLEWKLLSCNTVKLGSVLILKRQHVRYIDGAPVDFKRYSYEFITSTAASVTTIPSLGSSLPGEGSAVAFTLMSGSHDNEETIKRFTMINKVNDEEDHQNTEFSTPLKISRLNGGSAPNKRSRSLRCSSSRRAKVRRLDNNEECLSDMSDEIGNGGSAKYSFDRVLVHYLGTCDAEHVSPISKRISGSSAYHSLPVICRAVPLTCSDGCLQTASVGPNSGIHRRMSAREAMHLLSTTDPCGATLPIPYPRAGLWCVLQLVAGDELKWSSDGYVWRNEDRARYFVEAQLMLHKRYRRSVLGNSVHLYRHVYHVPELAPAKLLVHYLGLDDDPEPLYREGVGTTKCKRKHVKDEETGFEGSDSWPVLTPAEEAAHSRDDTTVALAREGLSVLVVTSQLIPLEMEHVIRLIKETPEEDCLTFAPTNPQNGHWFVFSYSGLHPVCQNAWKNDYIHWRHNGTRKRKCDDIHVNVRYYKEIFSGSNRHFMKYSYEILGDDGKNTMKRMLIHYLGKDSKGRFASRIYSKKLKLRLGIGAPVLVKVGDLTEGQFYTVQCDKFVPDLEKNTDNNVNDIDDSTIVETVTSILANEESLETPPPLRIKNKSVSGIDSSNNFFYEEVVSTSEPVLVPSYVLEDVSVRYSNDEGDSSVDSGLPYVYRIERNAIDCANDFLHRIKDTHSIFYQIIPTTIVIMACKAGISEFKSLSNTDEVCNIVFYDKLWKVGNLFVTCLYTRHILCEMESLFPLAFAIFELDDVRTHTIILENLLSHYKLISTQDILFITDASHGVLNACLEVLPDSMRPAASWVNIVQAVKCWFSKTETLNESWSTTVASINKLLQTQSIGEYNAHYQIVSLEWCSEFKTYYDDCLSHVVVSSNSDNLLALGMYSKFGPTISGSREFLLQMDNVFTDTEVATVDYLVHLAYYMLYYYHNEIEKGKLVEVGTVFRRKKDYAVSNTKKRCFFPSRCALYEDLAAAILHRMQVPDYMTKTESPSTVVEEIPEQDTIRELCNIEIDLDYDINKVDEHLDEFNDCPLQEVTIGEQVMNFEDDSNRYSSDGGQKTEVTKLLPVIEKCTNGKKGLKLASDSVLYERVVDNSTQRAIPLSVKENRPFVNKTTTSKGEHSKAYLRRKKIVTHGHNLFSKGLVSCNSSSGVYEVSSCSNNSVHQVQLAPKVICSCNYQERCSHIVAAMLEQFCQDDGNSNHCNSNRKNSTRTMDFGDLNDVPETIANGLVLNEEIVDDEYDINIGE